MGITSRYELEGKNTHVRTIMAARLLCDTVFIYIVVFSLKSAVMGVTSVGHCDKLWAKAGWVLCVTDIPRSPSEEAEAQLERDLPGQTARRCGSSNEGRGVCLPHSDS